MPIPSRQIGWSTQDNLLWQIAKQMEQTGCQLCDLNTNIQSITGKSGTSGTSGLASPSGTSGVSGTSGTSSALPISINYGLFNQTADSASVTGTNVETTILGSGVGTLTVPANGFTLGDGFKGDLGGIINAANNQTIRIRVKAGSIVLLDSGAQNLTSSITNDVWSLTMNFTIRQVGAAGVASIFSVGRFSYVKTNNGNVEGFGFSTLNNTTFDTTISNSLGVTVEWGSNNAGNEIHSDLFTLTKVY